MLSQQLKSLRNRKKLTQSELAKIIGVARTTYAMYEQGQREPDYETLIKIADYFDVTTDQLLGRLPRASRVSIPRIELPNPPMSVGEFNIRRTLDLDDSFEIPPLTPYNNEVLEWAMKQPDLHFKNKPRDFNELISRLEVAYEVSRLSSKN